MNMYIILEIGKAAYTEFQQKNGTFMETQDAIVVDEIEAHSKDEAYQKLIRSPIHKNKRFHTLVIKEVIL
ncbi:MAG: hypothetical protein ACMXYA_01135 [Candidatus Woesearchaeota archaeon]